MLIQQQARLGMTLYPFPNSRVVPPFFWDQRTWLSIYPSTGCTLLTAICSSPGRLTSTPQRWLQISEFILLSCESAFGCLVPITYFIFFMLHLCSFSVIFQIHLFSCTIWPKVQAQFGVEEPGWPAQDLNLAENVWDELKCSLQARSSHPNIST